KNDLADPENLRNRIFHALKNLLLIRKEHPAFSPVASQNTLALSDALFGVQRCDTDSGETITCVVNVTGQHQTLVLDMTGECLLSGEVYNGKCRLLPWQTVWIRHT